MQSSSPAETRLETTKGQHENMPFLSTFESRKYSRAALFTLWAFQVALNLAQVTIVIYVLPWIDSDEIEDMKPVRRQVGLIPRS